MNQRGFIVPSPMMLVGGVALAFGISTLLFWRLYQGAVDDLATYRAQVEAAQEQVRIENEKKLRAMADVNRRLDEGWTAAQSELARLGRVIRVQPNRCQGAVPAVSVATGTTDAAPAERIISTGECEAIANNAVEDAAKVIWLQQWIRDTHEAAK